MYWAPGAFLLLKKSSAGRIVRFGTIYPNFSFMGMPIVESLYGSAGILYFTILTVPIRLIYYSSAKPLLGGRNEGPKPPLYKRVLRFFSPPVAAVVVGLVLYFGNVTLPEPLSKAISSISATASPLGMIMCGMILSKIEFKSFFKRPQVFLLPFLRNMAAPAIALGLFLLLRPPVDALIIKVAVMYCALPCASMLTTFAVVYNPSEQARIESSVGVFSSTVLSIVTMPLWSAVLDAVIK